MQEILAGTPLAGTFDQPDRMKYYRITIAAGGDLRLALDMLSGGTAETWVRYGSMPTTTSYDYHNAAGGSHEFDIASAAGGTWYVMARCESVGTDGSYSIRGDFTPGADLVIGGVNVAAGNWPGANINFTTSQQNIGVSGVTLPSTYSLQVRLSTNQTWGDADDVVLGSISETRGLAAGRCR